MARARKKPLPGGCRKISFSKKAHADAAASKMRGDRDIGKLRAYRCPRCGRFHIGHDRYLW